MRGEKHRKRDTLYGAEEGFLPIVKVKNEEGVIVKKEKNAAVV